MYVSQIKEKWKIILSTSPLVGVFLSSPVLLLTGKSLYELPEEILFTTGLGIVVWCVQVFISIHIEHFRLRRIALWLCSTLVTNILLYFLFQIHHQDLFVSFKNISLLRISNGILLNSIIFILNEWYRSYQYEKILTEENHQLQLLHLQHKLIHLENQVNPHFLFNTLASLRHLIRKSTVEAEDYLLLLSSYLRKTLELEEPLIPIEKEIELSNLYIELQKIRFGKSIQYTTTGNLSNTPAFIPFLTLQNLIENALKHNIASVHNPLTIHIHFGDGFIRVENNLRPKKSLYSMKSGMGISITNKRLTSAGGKEILIEKSQKTFRVTLYLIIK